MSPLIIGGLKLNRSVLKFGGSSVSDFKKIKNIAEMLKTRIEDGEELIVVVSAMGKIGRASCRERVCQYV